MKVVRVAFGDEQVKHMDELVRRTGAKDWVDVIRRALACYDTLGRQLEAGVNIRLVSTGVTEDFVIEEFKPKP